jgi:hypothetical protein
MSVIKPKSDLFDGVTVRGVYENRQLVKLSVIVYGSKEPLWSLHGLHEAMYWANRYAGLRGKKGRGVAYYHCYHVSIFEIPDHFSRGVGFMFRVTK